MKSKNKIKFMFLLITMLLVGSFSKNHSGSRRISRPYIRAAFKTVEINKPIDKCILNDVYQKPLISFLSPNNEVINDNLTQVTDSSVRNDVIYAYSSSSILIYTPKYTDNNKNITCSVYSYDSKNVTLATTYKLNIVGVEIITNEYKEMQ